MEIAQTRPCNKTLTQISKISEQQTWLDKFYFNSCFFYFLETSGAKKETEINVPKFRSATKKKKNRNFWFELRK